MRLSRLAFVTSLFAGCTDDSIPKIDEPFALEDNGKADGSGLLSAADQQRMEAAFDEAITAGEATIQSLEKEIAKLEASHAAKQAEADALVTRISAREQELRDQANRNLLLCAFFPDPSICLVANLIANDSTLREFRRQLDAARAEQLRIRSEINTYSTKRNGLRSRLTTIRDGKQRLLTMLRDGTTATKLPAVVRVADREFAVRVSEYGPQTLNVTGSLSMVDDGVGNRSDGCDPMPAGSLTGKVVLVPRGTCLFVDKVKNVQAAGASGVILANNTADAPWSPPAVPGTFTIPSGMISQADGATLQTLVNNTASLLDHEVERSPQTASMWQRQAVMGKVATSIQQEIAVLVEIRNLAVELSNTLDHSLATLRALDQSVTQLVQQQRKQFMDRLFDLVSGGPGTLADKWLEDALAKRTRELLATLDWPLNEFARYLVETRGEGNPDDLLKRLLEKLAGGNALPPVLAKATTPVNILDFTDAQSAIDVTDTRTVTSLEVSVDIKHTFISDLVVSLEHDGKRFVLHNHAGGGDDDIIKSFTVPAAVGTSLRGRWVLHVEDTVKADVGQLRKWELIAR